MISYSDFIKKVVATVNNDGETKTSQVNTRAVINGIQKTLLDIMENGHVDDTGNISREVKFPKFISVKAKDIPEKVRRNPSTGGTITIPAHRVIDIKPSKVFKNILRK